MSYNISPSSVNIEIKLHFEVLEIDISIGSTIALLRKLFEHGTTIDIKKVDKQLTHAMHVKDRHVNDTFIDKLTKWYQ